MAATTKIFLAALLAVAAAAGGTAWYLGGVGPLLAEATRLVSGGPDEKPARPPPSVVVGRVERARVERTVEAVGNTVASETVSLVAEVPGRVVEISFTDGQRVEKGEVLVRIDRQIAEAELANVEAEAKQIEQELERAEYLLARGSGPRATADDTRRRLQAARARVESARERLEDTNVRAPFAGRVGLRELSVGAFVERTTTLATVDAIDPMDLRFTVPERYLGEIREGTPVRATTSAFPERVFEGEVRAIASRVDPATRTVAIEARLRNPEGSLLPGMLMNVSATLGVVEDALVVPPIAVLVRGSEQFVFLVGEGDKVERRPVTVGQREPDRLQIADGLEGNERLVVEGVQSITDGQEVRVRAGPEPDGKDGAGDLASRPRRTGGG